MAMTKTEIFNRALNVLGAKNVTSDAQDIKEANILNTLYDGAIAEISQWYPWEFRHAYARLTPESEQDVSSITYSGTTATVTLSSHGYETGYFIEIAGANESEYNGKWEITKLSANTFEYTMDDEPSSNASGDITARHVPPSFFSYVYSLPADFLYLIGVGEYKEKYVIHKTFLYADESEELIVEYVDTTAVDSNAGFLFTELLSLKLAAESAPAITGDRRLRQNILGELLEKFRDHAFILSTQDKPKLNVIENEKEFSWMKR